MPERKVALALILMFVGAIAGTVLVLRNVNPSMKTRAQINAELEARAIRTTAEELYLADDEKFIGSRVKFLTHGSVQAAEVNVPVWSCGYMTRADGVTCYYPGSLREQLADIPERTGFRVVGVARGWRQGFGVVVDVTTISPGRWTVTRNFQTGKRIYKEE